MEAKNVVILVIFALLVLSNASPILVLKSAAASNQKVVLAELFTATWCQYCPNATSAINTIESQEGLSQLLVLQYHPNDTDPLGCPQSEDRINYYGINGFPTIVFDGSNTQAGGLPTNYNDYKTAINAEMQKPTDVSIQLSGTLNDFSAMVASSGTQSFTATVRFAIYEDNISYNAPNGESVFRFAVRTLLSDQAITINPGQPVSVHRTFQAQSVWNTSNLGLVVFVQRDDTKEILQAATLTKPTPTFAISINKNPITVQPNQTMSFNVTLTNMGSFDDSYSIALTTSLPEGWRAGFCTGTICYWNAATIPVKASSSQELTIYITPSSNPGTAKATLSATSLTDPSVTHSVNTPDVTITSPTTSPSPETTALSSPSPTVSELPSTVLVAIMILLGSTVALWFKRKDSRLLF